ncbi:MAG TPA: type IV pilus assembly protein PilM [Pyrinomonadaceae bacterium]|nr:type IV pilus assembly protein PilM [Chloracidobacterium sp.]MBP9934806.1 type IV pilus assembly protein PilM [Pyrinomonadaceae bacterium]MBK7803164.1 type IV pilus assembly protein PilM [Chloracidobacterium sp.]MBK9438188.1 type IV pilus assembly protein PilM [Chloracidobacterium sp.]MBL0240935.1 type IV pilus assembly protein PilM [Chloracidobacterium sp.]
MLFGKKKSVAGLDIGSSSIKMVELEGKANNLSLVGLGFENLPSDTIIDGQIMELNTVSDVIQSVCANHQITATQVVTGVSGHSVIIKNIVLPPMSREELEESIDWHAEEHIPYDLADVSLDYQVTANDADSTHVLIAACKRERIDNIKQAIQLAGKQPVIIDVDTFALQNCYEANYNPTESDVVTLLNIGASTMNVNIVKGTRSLFTRDITVGGSQFTDVLQRSLGLNFQQAEAVKRGVHNVADGIEEKSIEPLMNNVTEIVAMEIQKTFDFYRATTEDNDTIVQKILISGGGSKLAGLAQELSQRLELPVEVLDPFRNIKVDPKKFDPEYLNEIVPEMAVAVGLAIRGV